MLKYLSKFFLEILPSVVATVVGAYIVNHYIAPRNPPADASRAAVVAPANSPPAVQAGTADGTHKISTPPVREARPEPPKAEPKPKTVAKAPAEKPDTAKPETVRSDAAKSDTAKGDTEGRRFVSHDKPVEKPAPPPPAPAETAAAPAADDHRDAAELARAALERLRASEPASRGAADPPAVVVREAPRESARVNVVNAVPAAPVTPAAPPVADAQPAVPPLPPPVSVALPADRAPAAIGSAPDGPQSRTAEADRLVPPADIPGPPPMDLQANAAPKKKSVAEDMLSAARSMFQSVVPQ